MKLLFISSIFTSHSIAAKKCNALALAGGGAKGAFEAGVLWGMYN
jgi:predicted acylesterase/phospholipase RssA